MDFIIDDTNNARNLAFLNKTKNQAKKLFKLAKLNQLTIEINNLSHAQEILAQINGFPDWHALETTISHIPVNSLSTSFSVDKENTFTTPDINNDLIFETFNNIAYVKSTKHYNETVTSFISVDNLPVSYDYFNDFMNDLIVATSFQYNMNFHNIEVFIHQEHIEKTASVDLQYFKHNDYCDLTKEQFEQLFKVNITPNFNNQSNFKLKILFSIETSSDMFDQHIRFCELLKNPKLSNYLTLMEQLSDSDYNSIYGHKNKYARFYHLNNSQEFKNSFNLSKFMINISDNASSNHRIYNHDKWIVALEALTHRQHNWFIKFNLNNDQDGTKFSLYHSENLDEKQTNLNERYLNGLFTSLINSTIYSQNVNMFEYLPLSKSTLPWNSGIPLINHTDKTIEHYQPYSASQTSYNTLIFAKPGSGKSLLLNTLNLAKIFSPRATQLPKMGVVDIGPASLSLVELVKATLITEDKHLVQYHKLTMEQKYGVNMFDTQLGSRFPLDIERNLLCNFLSLLITEPHQSNVESGMIGLIQYVIDYIYLHFSDKKQPKKYHKGVNQSVDQALSHLDISLDYRTTWWEVVDHLFLDGKIQEATLAQLYAVPTLEDFIITTNHTSINDIYSKLITSTGETLIEQFNRLIQESITNFPNLSKPTVFNVSDARIVVLDLDEVAKSGGAQANKQTAIMYMLARYILGKDYMLNDNAINQIPYPSNIHLTSPVPVEQYKNYYKKLFYKTREDYKVLSFDEFHRANQYAGMQSQLMSDFRNSRIYGYCISMTSQSLTDFNQELTSLASSVFIMDSGTEKENDTIADKFSLNQSSKQLLKYVHGPRSGKPGVFFAKLHTSNGNYYKSLSIPYNPFLLTALSTTAEDMIVRQQLTAIVGYFNAIKYLSKYYPYGVKKIIEQGKQTMMTQSTISNRENNTDRNIDNNTHRNIDNKVDIDTEILYIELISDIIAKEYKDR